MHVLFHSHSLQLPDGTSRVPCVHLGCSTAPHAPSVTLLLGEHAPAALPCTIHMQPSAPKGQAQQAAVSSGVSGERPEWLSVLPAAASSQEGV